MQLFNASSLFNETVAADLFRAVGDPAQMRERIIAIKKALLETYRFKAYRVPDDFTTASYVIATNHLTDSDAPLIMSYYYELMKSAAETYPTLFVFAKENCFNGVSVPKSFIPILEFESVFAVDRQNAGGSMATIKSAVNWFNAGKKPKHFLIFAQGTIYDINQDKAEDIEKGAFWLAQFLRIPVLPAFIEQAVEGEENRLIFGEPITISRNCRDFDVYKQLWLDRVMNAQNDLAALTGVSARKAVLDTAHQVRKKFK